MIKSFADNRTKRIWKRQWVKSLPVKAQRVGLRKLFMLNHAASLNDLGIPPGNHLKKLSGGRKGFWSIRINNQFRICFRWHNGEALDVEIVDYH
ncbi:MAG: type II toxin-antitoxin system RelE/ParE family toxin [Firmicutes bacterium]|nr:type II toxin-antitoxin system RelE/ParE family toxin [Bacillota bacterium]